MTKEVQQELLQFYTGLAEAAVKAEKWDKVDYYLGKIDKIENGTITVDELDTFGHIERI
jgi:hypothetical protein